MAEAASSSGVNCPEASSRKDKPVIEAAVFVFPGEPHRPKINVGTASDVSSRVVHALKLRLVVALLAAVVVFTPST